MGNPMMAAMLANAAVPGMASMPGMGHVVGMGASADDDSRSDENEVEPSTTAAASGQAIPLPAPPVASAAATGAATSEVAPASAPASLPNTAEQAMRAAIDTLDQSQALLFSQKDITKGASLIRALPKAHLYFQI